jgi:hypothetical protein
MGSTLALMFSDVRVKGFSGGTESGFCLDQFGMFIFALLVPQSVDGIEGLCDCSAKTGSLRASLEHVRLKYYHRPNMNAERGAPRSVGGLERQGLANAQDGWNRAQQYQSEPWANLVALWDSYNRHLAHGMAAIPDQARSNQCIVGSGAAVTHSFPR